MSAPDSTQVAITARDDWTIQPSDIEYLPNSLIGEGYFGEVHKVKWHDAIVVAKKLKNVRHGEIQNFISEVQVYTRLRHPYVVQFLGACTTIGSLAILTEYMTNGSLYNYIHGTEVIDVQTLLRMSIEIVTGLHYLHQHNIIHADLTTSNVLLDAKLTAKVSDFGLSRLQDSTIQMNGQGGNLLYMAPESFLLQQYNALTDVYSFGIMMNEMFSRTIPFAGTPPSLAVSEAANRGIRPAIASSCPVGVGRVITACWSHNATSRPSFKVVLQMLTSLQTELASHGTSGPNPSISSIQPSSRTKQKSRDRTVNTSGVATDTSSKKKSSRNRHSSLGNSLDKPSKPRIQRASVPSPSLAPCDVPFALHSKINGVPPLSLHAPIAQSFSSLTISPLPSPPPTPSNTVPITNSFPSNAAISPYDQQLSEELPSFPSTSLTSMPAAIQSMPSIPSKGASVKVTRDVRLFIECLKAHLPAHPSIVTSKPVLSISDMYELNTTATSTTTKSNHIHHSTKLSDISVYSSPTISSHPCSPSYICNPYPKSVPSIGELVICRVTGITASGALFECIEYNGYTGLAIHTELSRRRLRSIQKLVNFNELDVLRVIKVDEKNKYVDLSKKDISTTVRLTCLRYYVQVQTAHEIILNVAQQLQLCSYCLYSQLVWPLARKFDSTFKALRLSLVYPSLVFGEFQACRCTQRTETHVKQMEETNSISINDNLFLVSPRLLPEIERRFRSNSIHIDLSGLCLNQLPHQLTKPNSEFKKGSTKKKRSSKNHEQPVAIHVNEIISLNISDNPLLELPASLCVLNKLQELNANNCQLSSLPDTYQMNTLNRLYLYGNKFTSLPSIITYLHNLQQLNLSHNNITVIEPNTLSTCIHLSELSLSHNQLTSLPADLSALINLRTFDISFNQLTTLPSMLYHLPQLSSLELKFNQITTISTEGITEPWFLNLEFFDLSGNGLNDISPLFNNINASFQRLNWLDLSGNNLSSLPSHLISRIVTTCANTATYRLPIRFLNLTHNSDIRCLPSDLRACAIRLLSDTDTSCDNKSNEGVIAAIPSSAAPPPLPASMSKWNISQVCSWLSETVQLPQYASVFCDNEINGNALFDLDKGDLKDMEITKIGHQKQILKSITDWKTQEQLNTVSHTSTNDILSPSRTSSQSSMLSIGDASPSIPQHLISQWSGGSVGTNNDLSMGAISRTQSDNISESSVRQTVTTCDIAHCERIKSVLLSAVLNNASLRAPVLMRCIVLCLCNGKGDIVTEACNTAVAAGLRASDRRGPIIAPFDGLYNGCERSCVSISCILPTLYCISVPALFPEQGLSVIENVISCMNEALEQSTGGGRVKICIRPYDVDILQQPTTGDANLLQPSSMSTSTATSNSTATQLSNTLLATGTFEGEILNALNALQLRKQEAENKKKQRSSVTKPSTRERTTKTNGDKDKDDTSA